MIYDRCMGQQLNLVYYMNFIRQLCKKSSFQVVGPRLFSLRVFGLDTVKVLRFIISILSNFMFQQSTYEVPKNYRTTNSLFFLDFQLDIWTKSW